MLSKSTFLLFFISISSFARSASYNDQDYDALLQIYQELNINLTPLCDSSGVFCNRSSVDGSTVFRVTRIVLKSRQLKGKLSPAIGKLSELLHLSFLDNQLTGHIPAQIMGCNKLQVLNLANNRLSGPIPPEISFLTHLRVLDLSSNMFEGDLGFLQSFHKLELVHLANNLFSGKLPESVRYFPNLRFMNISGNNLASDLLPLPVETWRDASINRYIFSESSQVTNVSSALSINNENRGKAFQWFVRFSSGILVGSATGFILCLILNLFVHSARDRKTDTRLRIFSFKIKNPQDLAFLEREEALVPLQVIGRGACGEVYKAELPESNGIEIAIKKITQLPRDAGEIDEQNSKLINKKLRQIRSEVRTMGQIRHPNLLPLLAYLPQSSCHYLVFEYMKNGSLQDYLQHNQKELPWPERYRIALGVARGLEHLHKHSPRIIHRDLKPANILLDDEMEAKITDFGFAKALPDANSHASTSNVAGTIGYIAPEYYQTSKFTDKCDVYSFGVVLAVLVTGKFPSDEFFLTTDEISIMRWVRNGLTSEEPKRVIDPKLHGNGYEEQMLLVLKVAFFCTLNDPKERPNSTDVRCMLYQVKH